MRTIKISDETYEKIKSQLTGADYTIQHLSEMVGKQYFFRTVTYHLVGKVEKQLGNFFELSNASWIPDSGRFMDAIKSGVLSEVEPVGVAYVNLDSTTDFFPWQHELPTKQK